MKYLTNNQTKPPRLDDYTLPFIYLGVCWFVICLVRTVNQSIFLSLCEFSHSHFVLFYFIYVLLLIQWFLLSLSLSLSFSFLFTFLTHSLSFSFFLPFSPKSLNTLSLTNICPDVVYFDQLSGAARTQKLLETYFNSKKV